MLQGREHDAWEPISGMDASPMIGLVLTMLICVLVITPSIAGEAIWPRAATATPAGEGRVTIGIDPDGRYWLEDVPDPGPIPAHLLAGRLRQAYALRAPADSVLNLKADREVEYSAVLTLLDAAGEVGIRRIDAIVEPPRSPAPIPGPASGPPLP